MSDETIYLKLEQSIQVKTEQVKLSELGEILCRDKKTEKQVAGLTFPKAVGNQHGKYVHSVLEVIDCIQREFPEKEIQTFGAEGFVIEWREKKAFEKMTGILKTALVSLLSFFGAAFSIMTFNHDVDVTGLFRSLYELFMGQSSDGFTLLEISYSLGLGVGILLFFNHFAGQKLTDDPTPLEVQMRTYEDNVDQTLIEQVRRSTS
ncbi:MAG: stage V sporulation protein AA [Eubacteriales bacterium]|nr:stage V sporulation protein AA [Eubacteriales bacterium]